MTSHRMQHVVPGALILGLAAIVTYVSFTQEPADAFLFPRIIAVVFMALAIWNFVRAATGMAKVGRGFVKKEILNILPGLVVMLLLVFWAAKAFGFYVSSTIAFLAVYSLYDPVPFSSTYDWAKRLAVTLIFMSIIYGLFSFVLQVQTPRGMFI